MAAYFLGVIRIVTWALAVAGVVPLAVAAPAEAQRHVKLLVEQLAATSRIPQAAVTAAAARVIAEYPHSRVYEVPEAAARELGTNLSVAGFSVQELRNEILTPRETLNPRISPPGRAFYDAGLYLVQYSAPAMPAWQAQLRSSGLTVVDSLPERTVIVAGTAADLERVSKLPWVEYAGPYLPAFKYAPIGANEHGQFTVVVADSELAQPTIAWIREVSGGFVAESRYAGQFSGRVHADLPTALRFLEEPFVLAVETYVPLAASDERQAISLTGANSPAGGNYLNWLSGRNIAPNDLTASGIVVDVADSGIDTGCTSAGHLDLDGRRVYYRGIAPLNGAGGDTLYHGTIVAGIVGGNPVAGQNTAGGATNGFGYQDNDSSGSFYYGLGVAPGIRLGSTMMTNANGNVGTVAQWTTSAVTSNCNVPTNLCATTGPLCRAVVQTHSHNEYDATGSNAGVYTANAREFDISVRNADRVANVPLAVTISAGNYRQRTTDSTTQVLAPATAKNVISVGGTESARDAISACTSDGTVENPVSRHSAQGYNVLGYMSRRGTNDSRLKPDLVAPATLAMGPRTAAMAGPASYCAWGGGGGGTYLWPQYQGSSGTSFAAPVAAGAIALLRYYYGANHSLQPSPAMYKAMLVADAQSISGSTDRQTNSTVVSWPNAQQGFGRLTLDDLMNSSVSKSWHDQGTILLQGQIYERTVTVTDPAKPVRIALAWTDAPATAGSAVALVNNLNMHTYGPDHWGFYGNFVGTSGYSTLATSINAVKDSRNNVEVININPSRFVNTQNRTFTVRVTASVLNGQGVPGASGGSNNQDFALFVLNGTMQ
jgi:Subtilase family